MRSRSPVVVREGQKPRGFRPLGFSIKRWFHPAGTNGPRNVCIYLSPSAVLLLLEADLLRVSCVPALQLYLN